MFSQIASFETLRTVAFGAITNAYTPFGTPLSNVVRIFKITNTTDGDILISLGGVNNNIIIPAGTFTLYDLTANKGGNILIFALPTSTQFYLKYVSAPTKGSVYLECIYGIGE